MPLVTRSTTLSLKFGNAVKRDELRKLVDDARVVAQRCLEDLWGEKRITTFVSATNVPETSLTAIALQAIGKQVSAVIRGERNLARRCKREPSLPTLRDFSLDLDERLATLEVDRGSSFDGWLTVKCFKSGVRGHKLHIPLRLTKRFREFLTAGWTLKKTLKVVPKINCVVVTFEKEIEARTCGDTLGVDVGIADVVSDSRGHRTSDHVHPHGWTMSKVLQRIQRRKKGSKGSRRARALRDNFVGWAVNKLNLDGVRELKLEDLRGMKRGRHADGLRRAWTYPTIFQRLSRRAEEQNVSVTLVDPRNTSRTCSACGAVDAESRKDKSFRCVACGHAADADLNAAINISRARAKPVRRGVYSPSREERPENRKLFSG